MTLDEILFYNSKSIINTKKVKSITTFLKFELIDTHEQLFLRENYYKLEYLAFSCVMANNEKESCLKRGRQIFCLDKVKEKDMKIYLYTYQCIRTTFYNHT